MIIEIEWIERNKRYITVEVDSIKELSDFKPILREGKEYWLKLEDNSIKFKEVLDDNIRFISPLEIKDE
jgi:hypothetical protein|tara:strand:+ start:200 stop:406 length:207 start_codon:yes stop_codon:yes gene_type:complete